MNSKKGRKGDSATAVEIKHRFKGFTLGIEVQRFSFYLPVAPTTIAVLLLLSEDAMIVYCSLNLLLSGYVSRPKREKRETIVMTLFVMRDFPIRYNYGEL